MNTVADAAFLTQKSFHIPSTMKAWVLGDPDQLSFVDKPVPQPGPAECLVRIDAIAVCATDLEARVRELRLIAEHKPPYNRRSRHPERQVWLALTREPHPRVVTVSAMRDSHLAAIGPFASRGAAALAAEALHEALPLRTCTDRLPRGPRRSASWRQRRDRHRARLVRCARHRLARASVAREGSLR